MNGDGRLTCREKQLIKELTLTVAEVNSANSEVREVVFRSLASYVEGIKVGMKFPTRVNVQEMSVKDSLS